MYPNAAAAAAASKDAAYVIVTSDLLTSDPALLKLFSGGPLQVSAASPQLQLELERGDKEAQVARRNSQHSLGKGSSSSAHAL
ncbi:hypothetical protein HXX76_008595 [Chlamydomonas incerta]|uniref:Uncharacterized protein n=1 Tax=Chlamydomonas incerta TaxID=51695 RepID=A0A835STK0_CHLIN|nr:hypothetical protein HXX76_008595 [Chlamydomonas incerta]|eukprot:KAG2432863.1 hypothetical protein HXX76_008595 [Chlamydomonas incerta]